MQKQLKKSTTFITGCGELLTYDLRNGSIPPVTNQNNVAIAADGSNESDFFDCLKPFDYEAFLRREGLC